MPRPVRLVAICIVLASCAGCCCAYGPCCGQPYGAPAYPGTVSSTPYYYSEPAYTVAPSTQGVPTVAATPEPVPESNQGSVQR